MEQNTAKENRLVFMDVLRIAAFAVIISYHFFTELYRAGRISFDISNLYAGNNMNAVMTAVSLFFLISGAGLAISAGNAGVKDWKRWYSSRFFKLLIPFYIAFLITMICFAVAARSFDYFRGIPFWRIIFSLTATDGYVMLLGMRTFYLAVGEWFLGCLVVCYLFFPVFYTCIKKHRTVSLIVLLVFYAFFILTYRWRVPIYENLFVKACSFVLGMILIKDRHHVSRIAAFVSVLVFLIGLLPVPAIPLPISVKSDITAAALFILFMHLEKNFSGLPGADRISRFVSKYTYEIYLIHHSVILMFAGFGSGIGGSGGVIITAAGCIAVMAAVVVFMKWTEQKIGKFL